MCLYGDRTVGDSIVPSITQTNCEVATTWTIRAT
jgi:hypothetical protein